MFQPVSTLSGFKRMVSRVSTVILVAAVFNLALTPLFEDRAVRLLVCPLAIVMSLTVKWALVSYDAKPARSLSIIESSFYGLCLLSLAGSIYHFFVEPDLRSFLGVLLFGVGLVLSLIAVRTGWKSLQFARSLLSSEQV